jgi:protein-S-isoprenylcysteine O-methyltransferase Ste14
MRQAVQAGGDGTGFQFALDVGCCGGRGFRVTYSIPFAVLWVAWGLSWVIAARWASPVAARPKARQEWGYWALVVAGAVLIGLNFRTGERGMQWMPFDTLEQILFVVALAGLGFTWWARFHLGTLWSGRVTRKAHHRIIKTGPYAIVRHPIYAGISLALVATVLLRPGWLGLIGAALIIASFVIKYRLEERFLLQELGPEYADYRMTVAALVPFFTARG